MSMSMYATSAPQGDDNVILRSGCMQTWYQSQTVHPDMLHARVCGARGAPVRCTPTPSGAAGQAIFSAEHPGIPGNPYWISVLILNLDLTFLNCTEGLGRIAEWIVGGQTPRAWKVISLR